MVRVTGWVGNGKSALGQRSRPHPTPNIPLHGQADGVWTLAPQMLRRTGGLIASGGLVRSVVIPARAMSGPGPEGARGACNP